MIKRLVLIGAVGITLVGCGSKSTSAYDKLVSYDLKEATTLAQASDVAGYETIIETTSTDAEEDAMRTKDKQKKEELYKLKYAADLVVTMIQANDTEGFAVAAAAFKDISGEISFKYESLRQ